MFSAYFLAFVLSLFLSITLTWLVRNFSNAKGWTVGPRSDRHLHTIPVPRLGGVAIYVSFVAIVVTSTFIFPQVRIGAVPSAGTLLGILGPATLVFGLGLFDDLHSVSAYKKFAIQAVAAVWLYVQGFGIHQLDLIADGHPFKWAYSLPLTVLWVLLITNAFNLIDGLDGLAAGSALFSISVVLVLSLVARDPLVAFLAVAMAGATLGFLRFNFHPASIFLGDSGSLFIGFMLGALALAGSQKAPTMVAVSIPVLSLGLPILDVTLAVARRFLAGKPLFGADRAHIHHKLLKRGLSQREVVVILYAVSAAFGFLSLALMQGRGRIAFILAVTGVGIFVGVQQLRYQEFAELVSVLQRITRRRQFVANQVAIRLASEMLNESNDFPSICNVLQNTLKPIGFDAVLFRKSGSNGFAPDLLHPLCYSEDGAWMFSWCDHQTAEVAWELKLQLKNGCNGTAENWGYFSLLRSRNGDPLLLDTNLLCDEFLKALSAAVERASTRLHDTKDAQQAFAKAQ